MEEAQASIRAPAISVSVAVNGEIVWSEAHGYSNLESHDPVGLDSASSSAAFRKA